MKIVFVSFLSVCFLYSCHDCNISGTIADSECSSAGGSIADPVDMGLSVLWASHNVGASSEHDFGAYFAWAEPESKELYDIDNYAYLAGLYSALTKYCGDTEQGHDDFSDNLTMLEPSDDAASVNWGGSWRTPTSSEWDELRTMCSWSWIHDYRGSRICGFVVQSLVNGNRIFLPSAGYRYDAGNYYDNCDGFYWSSSLCTSNPNRAIYVDMSPNKALIGSFHRYCGLPVRPVCPHD